MTIYVITMRTKGTSAFTDVVSAHVDRETAVLAARRMNARAVRRGLARVHDIHETTLDKEET